VVPIDAVVRLVGGGGGEAATVIDAEAGSQVSVRAFAVADAELEQ
jgi:hypothetical protein